VQNASVKVLGVKRVFKSVILDAHWRQILLHDRTVYGTYLVRFLFLIPFLFINFWMDRSRNLF